MLAYCEAWSTLTASASRTCRRSRVLPVTALRSVSDQAESPATDVEPSPMAPAAQEEQQGSMEIMPEAAPVKRRLKKVKKFYARDFEDSTWQVAIKWKGKNTLYITKIFLRKDGSLVWLNNAKGTWKLQTKARTLSFYRDFFLGWKGKRIFTARLLDSFNEHYIQGDIKGWGPWFALERMGDFQAVRLGVDLNKYGPAPWLSDPRLNDPNRKVVEKILPLEGTKE